MEDAQIPPGNGPAAAGNQPVSPAPAGPGQVSPPPGPGPKPNTAVPALQPEVPPAGAAAGPDAEPGGRTSIAEQAVAKVAAIAARSVPGVHTLGTGAGRTLGAVRDAVAGSDTSATAGVNVEVGETEAAVDITLVAEYGIPLTGLADAVRSAVYAAVEDLVGLNVVEVNVSVADVHIPDALDPRTVKRQPGTVQD
ncbi:Asp23/Gls24 family envelope stress response protein [Arthrobacter koreensis]|uniref:Asp23/Gls24 family envelope stress response protein n=1 Tax=Arthrobacter koreensis TaxID=199136 RepID=UPI002DB9E730|nr:Asp23/Gls24 family envelope stress response protein [Arthrobacter koreensis]MEB7503134.1 Asp23/Gls24 family envelope stress response protein [Arthrobacter koreensis]